MYTIDSRDALVFARERGGRLRDEAAADRLRRLARRLDRRAAHSERRHLWCHHSHESQSAAPMLPPRLSGAR
jgi:hypothetical protein